jgi:hypothetical protein
MRYVEIPDSVDSWLQGTCPAIANMSAIVVVAEENGSADEILRADSNVMHARISILLIALSSFGRAKHNCSLRPDDLLTIPKMAFSIARESVSLFPAIQTTRF